MDGRMIGLLTLLGTIGLGVIVGMIGSAWMDRGR